MLALAYAGIAQAQTAIPSVVITAHPLVEDIGIDAYSSTSATLTEDQLRDQNAGDLASALRRTPGVQISRYNPVGAFGGDQGGAVFIRGMGVSRPGSEIKTYIDGVPFYMGVWNHPLLDLLPVGAMRTITVNKSPQPQSNGNNFAAVQMQTRQAKEDGIHGSGRISAGSFGTIVQQAELSGRLDNLDFMVAQGHAESDGHRANANGELNNLIGSIGLRLDDHWRIGASVLHVDNKARDPGDARVAAAAVAPEYNTRADMASAFAAHEHGDWRGELRAYHNSGDGNWLHQPAPDGDTLSAFTLSGIRWKEQFSPWIGATLLAGVDHDRVSGDIRFNRTAPAPSSVFDAPTFRITSPYIAFDQRVAVNADWTLVPSLGVRAYRHSQFTSRSAPHGGLSLVSRKLTLFANVSRGINYPGLEAPLLASLIAPLGSSWEKLGAEELDHAEVGAKYTPTDATTFDLSLFNDRVKNRYVFGFPPDVPPPPQFINLGTYRMRGAELSLRHALTPDWSISGGLTLLDADIDHLPYTPKRALTLGLNGRLGSVRLAIDAQYQSAVWALNRTRSAGALNTEQVGAFTVANARLAYPLAALGKKGEVFIAGENLFDREYAFRPGYAMPGRSVQLGVSASF